MKDLSVTASGDLEIRKHDLQWVKDRSLTEQKVRIVLSTNKGEWELGAESGINFRAFLVKNPNYEEIIDTIRDGLRQIDESFRITSYSFETVERHLKAKFTAENDSGEEISMTVGEKGSSGNRESTRTLMVCVLGADEVLRSGTALTAMGVCATDGTVLDCEL